MTVFPSSFKNLLLFWRIQMMFLWGCFCEDQAELLCFFLLLTWDVRGTKELRISDASGMCPGLAVCYLATFLTTCVPNATLLQTESFRIPSTILRPHLTPCLVFLQTGELERKNCRSRRTQQPFVLLSVFFAHLQIPEDHWKLHWVQTVLYHLIPSFYKLWMKLCPKNTQKLGPAFQ